MYRNFNEIPLADKKLYAHKFVQLKRQQVRICQTGLYLVRVFLFRLFIHLPVVSLIIKFNEEIQLLIPILKLLFFSSWILH